MRKSTIIIIAGVAMFYLLNGMQTARTIIDLNYRTVENIYKQIEKQQILEFQQKIPRLCRAGFIRYCILSEKKTYLRAVTYYNPVAAQTDGNPCRGAGLTNICEIAKKRNVLALSQDLVGRSRYKQYRYGDLVVMNHHEPACTGLFQIEDTMNKRWTSKADRFVFDNHGQPNCLGATIQKVLN